MTEADWLTATDPTPMLEFLQGKASERKLRLFAVACYQRLSAVVCDTFADEAIEVAERFTDSHATSDELSDVAQKVSGALDEFDFNRLPLTSHAALALARKVTDSNGWRAARGILVNATFEAATAAFRAAKGSDAAHDEAEQNEKTAQSVLLRDIFGNPFSPPHLDPSLRTSTVLALARGIYDGKTFDRLPVLADALADAGCDNADLLDHCHSDGPHVRGCWAVDLILGKV